MRVTANLGNATLELPPDARDLVEQVRGLEARAEGIRAELERDLDGIRQAARNERAAVEKELAARRKQAGAELADATAKVSAQRERLAEDRAALEALLENRVQRTEVCLRLVVRTLATLRNVQAVAV